MAEPRRRERSRETRLLLLTLLLSAVVLALLAQFRFPARTGSPPGPPATALDQLASRGAFDDEAAALRDLQRRLEPSFVRLRLRNGGVRPALGLRIRDDLAVLGLPDVPAVQQLAYETLADAKWIPAPVAAADEPRRLAVVRIPPSPAPVLRVSDVGPLVPGYLAAFTAGAQGPETRPIWIGALVPTQAVAWPATVWSLPAGLEGVARGALLFSLSGTFVGMAAADGGAGALVPGQLLLDRTNPLAEGRTFLGGDAGVTAQNLSTPALQAATGRREGALVASVDPDGPAGERLQRGDVIVRLDAEEIGSAEALARALAQREAGAEVTLTVDRGRTERRVPVTLRATAPPAAGAGLGAGSEPVRATQPVRSDLGLTLRQRGNEVEVAAVAPATPGALAGLSAGDRITWMPGVDRLTAAALRRAYADLEPGGAILIAVAPRESARRERLAAIQKP